MAYKAYRIEAAAHSTKIIESSIALEKLNMHYADSLQVQNKIIWVDRKVKIKFRLWIALVIAEAADQYDELLCFQGFHSTKFRQSPNKSWENFSCTALVSFDSSPFMVVYL